MSSQREYESAGDSGVDRQASKRDERWVILGIGTPQGGFSALLEMLGESPKHVPMSFVVVKYPEQIQLSVLSEILQQATSLIVKVASDPVRIKDRHVYLIPAGKHISIKDSVLRLTEATETSDEQIVVNGELQSDAAGSSERRIGIAVSATASQPGIDVADQKYYEAELEKARLEAEAASRAQREFLANMSHEMRTPMSAILGYADILREHLKDPDHKQRVETIRRNGRFLLKLVNDILDISRIDAGKMVIATERIAPQEILADVVSLMNVRAEEQKLELVAEFEDEVPTVIETDGKRLRQILLNLTSNAIKFTPDGCVRLTSRFNHQTGKLEFSVSDTGIGIEPCEIENLFQPFTQSDASSTRSFGGAGLGLAISRRLAHMLGGDIHAESQPGKGSTFTLSLDPGRIDNIPFAIPSIIGDSPTSQTTTDIKLEGRFLVVDDRRDIRFLAQNSIENAGGTVETANNGLEAIEAVQKSIAQGRSYSAILMDMQMPVMDGYEAVAELRRRGVELPIVALTANAMKEDREKCLALGCTDFLSKPLEKSELLQLIVKVTSSEP